MHHGSGAWEGWAFESREDAKTRRGPAGSTLWQRRARRGPFHSKTVYAGIRAGGAGLRRQAGRFNSSTSMETVTLSPRFEVVIPPAIREALHLTAGEQLRVLHYAGRVEFIPVRPARQLRGFLRDMDTSIDREADRL